MVEDGRVSDQRYDKVRLTPFGETMPYIASIPGLQQKLLDFGARGMRFDLSEGTRQTVFTFNTAGGSVRVVTPICFEVTVAPYVRGMVFEKGVRRADILVNVTNDGWFGGFSPAREQHLQIARWRSLELATPMIRAANTGISCSISADGKVHQLGPQNGVTPSLSQGLLIAGVEPGTKVTIYARLGEFTGWSTVVGTLAIAMFAGRRAAKGGQTANPPIGGGVA
jgi:apolipoprotein N-acyltransferase